MRANLLGKIHNDIYANEGLGRQEAFDEIIKILLVKIFDEKERLDHFFISKDEWAKVNGKGRCRTFTKRIEELRKYADLEKISLSLLTLAQTVKALQKERILGQKNLAGEIFSKFIADNQKAERGQFFTPKGIIELAIEATNPRRDETVLDPACGGGGFLIETINYLGNDFRAEKVVGFEINPRVALIAKLGVGLAGGDASKIRVTNSLKESEENIADVILANPPFGTKGRIREKRLLDQYEIASGFKSMVPEVLFVEKCFRFLRPNGRMAIVLPNGILEGKSNKFVRKFVSNNFAIQEIIDLPEKTFSPYGTNVKTTLVILVKSKEKSRPIQFGKLNEGKVAGKYEIMQEKIKDRLDYQFNKPSGKPKSGGISLGEVIGLAPQKKPKTEKKLVYYVEISGINTTNLAIDYAKKVEKYELPKRARYRLKKGDILVSLVGNYLGTKRQAVALVDGKFAGAWCSNGVAVIRESTIDPYYLLYFFKSDYFLGQVEKYKTQTTIPRMTVADFLKTKIRIADREEMNKRGGKIKEYIKMMSRAREIYKLEDSKV